MLGRHRMILELTAYPVVNYPNSGTTLKTRSHNLYLNHIYTGSLFQTHHHYYQDDYLLVSLHFVSNVRGMAASRVITCIISARLHLGTDSGGDSFLMKEPMICVYSSILAIIIIQALGFRRTIEAWLSWSFSAA